MIRHAQMIRVLLYFCFSLQLCYFLLAWAAHTPSIGTWVIHISPDGLSDAAARSLGLTARAIGFAIGLPCIIVLGYGLWHLDRMLLLWQREGFFTLMGIGHLRAFAGATLLSVLLGILEMPVRGIAFGSLAGNTQQKLSIGVNSQGLMLIFVCSLFYLICGLMQEARKLAEENEGFV